MVPILSWTHPSEKLDPPQGYHSGGGPRRLLLWIFGKYNLNWLKETFNTTTTTNPPHPTPSKKNQKKIKKKSKKNQKKINNTNNLKSQADV